MARRVVACTACAATWTDRRARFCGRCGAPLRGSGDLPAGTDDAARRAKWRLAAILTGAVAIAALVAAVAVTDLLSFLPRGADPEVALPTPEVFPTGNRLQPDETRALRQQVDPNRLRCEPRGCELWRRSMSIDPEMFPRMVGLHDLVVFFEGTNLVALDRATGEERWIEPFDDLLPEDATGARYGESEWQMLAILDDALVIGAPQHVAFIGADGVRGWVTAVPRGWWGGEVTDNYLLLHGEVSGSSRMWVIDLDDGRIMWERDGTNYYSSVHDDRVLVAGDRRLEVVNVSDGEVVWSYEFGPDSPIPAGVHRDAWFSGDVVVVAAHDVGKVAGFDTSTGTMWTRDYNPSGWPMTADTWIGIPMPDSSDIVLVDSATGADLTTFANATVNEWAQFEDAWVLLLTPHGIRPDDSDDRHARGARLVAVDRDGDVMWETAVEMERRCCTWLRSDEPGVVAVMTDDDIVGTVTALRVDVASGTTLEVADDPSDPAIHGWQAPDGTWVGWGDNDVTVLRRGDHSTRILPADAWQQLEGTPWVFTYNGEIIGIQLMPDG